MQDEGFPEEKKPFRQIVMALVTVYLSSCLPVVFTCCWVTRHLNASLWSTIAFWSLIWTLLLAVPVAIIAGRTPWKKTITVVGIIALINGLIIHILALGFFIWAKSTVVI
jgi:hypothetical protein